LSTAPLRTSAPSLRGMTILNVGRGVGTIWRREYRPTPDGGDGVRRCGRKTRSNMNLGHGRHLPHAPAPRVALYTTYLAARHFFMPRLRTRQISAPFPHSAAVRVAAWWLFAFCGRMKNQRMAGSAKHRTLFAADGISAGAVGVLRGSIMLLLWKDDARWRCGGRYHSDKGGWGRAYQHRLFCRRLVGTEARTRPWADVRDVARIRRMTTGIAKPYLGHHGTRADDACFRAPARRHLAADCLHSSVSFVTSRHRLLNIRPSLLGRLVL